MYVHRPDARIFYQVTGSGRRDLFLLPPCQVVTHSRMWKHQIPYLSRSFRVITMDPRGNGRSDRPATGYDLDTRYHDLLSVLEEVARPPFALVAFSCAGPLAFRYAAEHPSSLSHLVLVSGQYAESVPQPFDERVARVIRDDFDGWRERLFRRIYQEPHSLKGIEDSIAWAGETTPEILIESLRAIDGVDVRDLLGGLRVPTLALHGTRDKIVPYSHAQKMVAAIPGARLVTFADGGHALFARDAVKVNRLIRDFVLDREVEAATIPATTERTVVPAAAVPAPAPAPAPAPRRAGRGSARRVLWLSSSIGLGHIQRDLAIARRLRERHPDVAIDFLAANPADRVIEHWGARLHPASRLLLNESAHFEGWAADHELHAQGALWDMDEIFTANFMTFADVVERERYDLWVGDEGWELDYFLHENPELKRAPYAFLTDFIGVLPMRDDPGSTEFARCREKNAENIDHLRLHPDVRDLSLLIGEADDVLDLDFAPGLPNMRQWAREHFRFSGYTFHFDPRALADRAALRDALGYRPDERVILASVGGTRAGHSLLQKCARAFALVTARIPEARLVLVTGPRLDEVAVPAGSRVEVRPFVPDLFQHHAAVDLAIVQGGLTTTMELAAFGTPFLYFPLRNHFEQQLHVARRLDRLGAGQRLDFDRTTDEELGEAIVRRLGQPAAAAPVRFDGTDRAARLLAELL
jgi:pimeloyl-ACP methyl ester carboxylesterase/predicted glycosyltransferase